MKKIFYYIAIFIISIFILINIFSSFNLSFFGIRVFKVASGSMEPKIKVNDFVIVKKINNYKKGDIVTFKNENGEYVTHRIISVKGKKYNTKGDSNNLIDKPISKKSIVGKVVYKSYILSFLNKLFTSVIFWLIVPLIIGISFLIPKRNQKESS